MKPLLREAVALFNRRDYFASQERFEQAWHESEAADRRFIEALVQLAVAFHLQFHRGGWGCEDLLQRCLARLEECQPARLSIDVRALRDEVARCLESRKRTSGRGPRHFERWRVPKIKLLS